LFAGFSPDFQFDLQLLTNAALWAPL